MLSKKNTMTVNASLISSLTPFSRMFAISSQYIPLVGFQRWTVPLLCRFARSEHVAQNIVCQIEIEFEQSIDSCSKSNTQRSKISLRLHWMRTHHHWNTDRHRMQMNLPKTKKCECCCQLQDAHVWRTYAFTLGIHLSKPSSLPVYIPPLAVTKLEMSPAPQLQGDVDSAFIGLRLPQNEVKSYVASAIHSRLAGCSIPEQFAPPSQVSYDGLAHATHKNKRNLGTHSQFLPGS